MFTIPACGRDWHGSIALYTIDKVGNITEITETEDGCTPQLTLADQTLTGTQTPVVCQNLTAGPNVTVSQPHRDPPTPDGGVLRTYTYGPAGHLESVDAAGNLVDFTSDAAGRLANLARPLGSKTTDFSYDGRSFVIKAETPLAGGPDTATTEATSSTLTTRHSSPCGVAAGALQSDP